MLALLFRDFVKRKSRNFHFVAMFLLDINCLAFGDNLFNKIGDNCYKLVWQFTFFSELMVFFSRKKCIVSRHDSNYLSISEIGLISLSEYWSKFNLMTPKCETSHMNQPRKFPNFLQLFLKLIFYFQISLGVLVQIVSNNKSKFSSRQTIVLSNLIRLDSTLRRNL